MKTFTIEDIRLWEPCYDPSKYLTEDWSGTVVDLLDVKDIPFQDRLWVICRQDLLSDKLMRLFAVWCARQVQYLMADQRSINALDVAECFANGQATDQERAVAEDAARAAAADAAWAAEDAAWAAEDAAWAAEGAARAAARAAAEDATWAAEDAARDAARADARAAAGAAQENKLREMLLAGVNTGDVK